MNVTPNKGKNVARKWYTDLDINLTAHPQSGDLVLKQDKEAIKIILDPEMRLGRGNIF